jgi:hypothetical protein
LRWLTAMLNSFPLFLFFVSCLKFSASVVFISPYLPQ